MELPILIGVVAVVVVVVLVTLGVRTRRSRSARSDWLGELTEIRRSSLGDDEEVTGALEAVTVIDDDGAAPRDDSGHAPDPDGRTDDGTVDRGDGAADGAGDDRGTGPDATDARPSGPDPVIGSADEGPTGPVTPAGDPARTVAEADRVFDEYAWPGFGDLRIDRTDPQGLRVMVEGREQDPVGLPRRAVVDLPHGSVWFRSGPEAGPQHWMVRTTAGWVSGRGDVLILAEDADWIYVLCLDGEAMLRTGASGDEPRIGRGQIGRLDRGSRAWDVVEVGVDALVSEPVVRRHRRLDAAGPTPSSPDGAPTRAAPTDESPTKRSHR